MKPQKSCLKKGESISLKRDRRKEVVWGDLSIYEFPNILGDNPGVSEGAPLTIGWKHESKNIIGVDYYEYLRQNRPRRKRKDLVLSSTARDTYLLGLGYKLEQLIAAAEETKKIRTSRRANMSNKWDKFRQVFDKATTGVFRKSKHPSPKIVVAKSG